MNDLTKRNRLWEQYKSVESDYAFIFWNNGNYSLDYMLEVDTKTYYDKDTDIYDDIRLMEKIILAKRLMRGNLNY
jgi:hypothetical protein